MTKSITAARINRNLDPRRMPGEEFRPVTGFEGRYEVSSLGRVRSTDGAWKQIRKPQRRGSGHLTVDLYRGGERTRHDVRELVAREFHGPAPEGKTFVLNINGDVADCSAENIAWADADERMDHTVLHGEHPTATKTHCKHGHEFNAANTAVEKGRRRVCRACRSAQAAARRARDKGQSLDIRAYADRKYIELTTEPGADLTPVLARGLSPAPAVGPKACCKYGHEFNAANTIVEKGRKRVCRACRNARDAARRAVKTGRTPVDVRAYADRRYTEIISAPGADLTPALSPSLAQAADDPVAA